MGRCNHDLKHRDRCDNRPATPKDDGPIVGAWTRVWRQTHTLVVSLPATARPASSAGRSRDPLPAMPIVCAARSDTSCSGWVELVSEKDEVNGI
jgi:hypothetical protein